MPFSDPDMHSCNQWNRYGTPLHNYNTPAHFASSARQAPRLGDCDSTGAERGWWLSGLVGGKLVRSGKLLLLLRVSDGPRGLLASLVDRPGLRPGGLRPDIFGGLLRHRLRLVDRQGRLVDLDGALLVDVFELLCFDADSRLEDLGAWSLGATVESLHGGLVSVVLVYLFQPLLHLGLLLHDACVEQEAVEGV